MGTDFAWVQLSSPEIANTARDKIRGTVDFRTIFSLYSLAANYSGETLLSETKNTICARKSAETLLVNI